MATKLDTFPITPRRTQRSYPWDDWTDGGTWRLVRGEDFDQEVEAFRNKLYTQATKRGLKVRTHKEQLDADQVWVAGLSVNFDGHFVTSESFSPTNVAPSFLTLTMTSRPSRKVSGTAPL